MGFFSWKTADTNVSIMNKHSDEGPTPCKMLDNMGNAYIENNYDGYGVFGGIDFFLLTLAMNFKELKIQERFEITFNEITITFDRSNFRSIGIQAEMDEQAHCYPEVYKLPKLVSINCTLPYDCLANNDTCPGQGYWSE